MRVFIIIRSDRKVLQRQWLPPKLKNRGEKMNKLKYWRQEKELSQVELAVASGVPRWTIQLVESAAKTPSENEQIALSEALGVNLNKLFPKLNQTKMKRGG